MNTTALSIVSIVTAIVGVAFLAVLVSRNSNTAGVIKSGGDALSQFLNVAVSPVTGGNNFGINSPLGIGGTIEISG